MTAAKHNPSNERIKRQYYAFLKEAKRQSESSIDAAARAVDRFEVYNRYRDFKAFHVNQAIGFKNHLAKQRAHRSGQKLSQATLHEILSKLKRLFQWLSYQPGYKSRIRYTDADYFNLSDNDMRIATARREKPVPTLEQIIHVINQMLTSTDVQLRNRALIAFTLLTGARDSATASMKLKHVDIAAGCVYQDAREVRTKFRKTFKTYFFPVGDHIHNIIHEWVHFLREEKLWGADDPLFPATRVDQGPDRQFEVVGLSRTHWNTSEPIRKIFGDAFQRAGLAYFNPHSFRNTLVRLGEVLCKSPEEFKAWSQNLGHEHVMTAFLSYGEVPSRRQAEIIKNLAVPSSHDTNNAASFAKLVAHELRKSGFSQ